MNQSPDEPKLHVDSDWKAQAEAEREKLLKIDNDRATPSAAEAAEKLPPADFRSIVGLLATQALSGLGAYRDPETQGVMVDLVGARFAIDLLGVLSDKTKGNLSAEESKELTEILVHLRQRFVQITQLIAAQAAQGNPAAVSAAMGTTSATSKSESAKPKLIIPG